MKLSARSEGVGGSIHRKQFFLGFIISLIDQKVKKMRGNGK